MWRTKKLSQVCDIQSGLWKGKKEPFTEAYVLRNTNFTAGGKFDYTDVALLQVETKQLEKRIVLPNDIILEKSGGGEKTPVGRVCLHTSELDKPVSLSNFTARLRVINEEELLPSFLHRFLYFLYISGKTEPMQRNSTGIRNLQISQYKDIEVPLPPLAEQQRIVAKLDAAFAEIDAAIDLTMQKNENTSVVLNQFLATIKADTVKLDDIVQIKTGKLDANAMVEGGEYPFFTCSKQIYEIDKFAFDCDAVLLAGNNASGDFNVKHYTGKFNAYQRTYVITVKDMSKLRSRYLYFQLIQALAKFKTMSVGTNTKFLKLGMIKNFEIPLPSIAQQDAILEKLQKLEQNLQILEDSSTLQLSNYFALKSAILAQELQSEAA